MVEKLQGKRKYVSFRPESSPKVAVFEEMRLHLPTFYAFDLKSFRKDCGEACKQASVVNFRLTALLRALHHWQTPMDILLKTPANHI